MSQQEQQEQLMRHEQQEQLYKATDATDHNAVMHALSILEAERIRYGAATKLEMAHRKHCIAAALATEADSCCISLAEAKLIEDRREEQHNSPVQGNHFVSFEAALRYWYEQWQKKEKAEADREPLLTFKQGGISPSRFEDQEDFTTLEVVDIPTALKRLGEEEKASAGGFNFERDWTGGKPLFLRIYDNSSGYSSRHSIVMRREVNDAMQAAEREAAELAATSSAPGSYFVCTVVQNDLTGEVGIGQVVAAHNSREQAERSSIKLERSHTRGGDYSTTTVVRKAHDWDAALVGQWLD